MRLPLTSYVMSQGFHTGHQAIDMAAPTGTHVLSPIAGTVISVNRDTKYFGGMYVTIRENHGDKLEHYMGHHSAVHVNVGQTVKQGQHIANVGMTGATSGPNRVTGPHVHYQIRRPAPNNKILVNPLTVLSQRNVPEPAAQGGNIVFNNTEEVQQAYVALRGQRASDAEARSWVGLPRQRWFTTSLPEANSYRTHTSNLEKHNKNLTNQVNALNTQVQQLNSRPTKDQLETLKKDAEAARLKAEKAQLEQERLETELKVAKESTSAVSEVDAARSLFEKFITWVSSLGGKK